MDTQPREKFSLVAQDKFFHIFQKFPKLPWGINFSIETSSSHSEQAHFCQHTVRDSPKLGGVVLV
jgi:hypothetical protein